MSASTAARDARLSAAVDRAFGEEFAFVARKLPADVDMPRVADASRPPFSAVGTWSAPSRERHPDARGHASDNSQGIVAAAPCADFDSAALTWQPVEGDLCTRVETSDTYAVARVIPDGFGRVTLILTAKQR